MDSELMAKNFEKWIKPINITTALYVDNGKKPEEALNARLLFWLPNDSAFGNFQLKLMQVVTRVDEINRNLKESEIYWTIFVKEQNPLFCDASSRHMYANEKVIYFMRRVADEIISLSYCLMMFDAVGKYPGKIMIDSIGEMLKEENRSSLVTQYFVSHLPFLNTLNEVSNAFKHSFVNSDLNIFGRDEPCVSALALKKNKIQSGVKFYNLSLKTIVDDFSLFYKHGFDWLREFSKRNLPKAQAINE